MRFAYVCADFGISVNGSKGAAVHVREMTQALVREGHEVIVLTPRWGGPAAGGYSVPVIELAPDGFDEELRELVAADPNGGTPLADELRGLLYAASLGQRSMAPLRDWRPDVIYERHALPGLAGRFIAARLGIPRLLEVNAPLVEEQARHRSIRLAATLDALEREALRTADAVLVVSSPLAAWAIQRGARRERVQVIANAVDPQRASSAPPSQARRALGLNDDVPIVGFVGTLRPWHDAAALVRAAAGLRRAGTPVRLLVVGDGPQRPLLQRLAAEEGLEELTCFTGAVAHDRVPDYLAAMDVGAVPYAASDEAYFSPLKLFEYGAAALPVVAADIGDVGHCIRDGVTGLRYPPGDQSALESCLARMLHAPADARRMGERLRRHVSATHTWRGNARVVAGLASGLLGGSPRRSAERVA